MNLRSLPTPWHEGVKFSTFFRIVGGGGALTKIMLKLQYIIAFTDKRVASLESVGAVPH